MNLDKIKDEILARLSAAGIAVFHGNPPQMESVPVVMWDTARHPGYQEFIETAKAAGVRLVVCHVETLERAAIEDSLERLGEAELERDSRRALEIRLRDLRPYEGFTGALEFSYGLEGRIFLFELRTEWYEEFLDILDQLDEAFAATEEDGGSMGFFSRN